MKAECEVFIHSIIACDIYTCDIDYCIAYKYVLYTIISNMEYIYYFIYAIIHIIYMGEGYRSLLG